MTDNRVFYRVDIDPFPPQLNFESYSLTVTGEVANPLSIDKTHLLSTQTMDQFATMECISNTINPPAGLIGNAKWTGVSLAKLLAQASPKQNAKYVVFHSAEGYEVGIPLEQAMNSETMLAYKMNDDFLPREHGYPLRAIVPGLYGMMSAKWITQIELVEHVYLGYWQTRGWSNDARIKTASIIYYPTLQAGQAGIPVDPAGYLPVAGIAFAGDRGISKVEVSTDGGNTWSPAYMKKPTSPYSWVLWAYEWTRPRKGQNRIMVRATDGLCNLQTGTDTVAFPTGATGYNSVIVHVT